ncbi:unnamed protein product [Sphagnum compactum]
MGKRRTGANVDGDEEKEEEEESRKAVPEVAVSDEESAVEVKVIGQVLKRSGGKGKGERKHYQAFEVDGCRYDVDDPVLVTPEKTGQKPYVAIIKEIKQAKDGSVQVTGQWFYRPEEAEKKGGGMWGSNDSRELFYSLHMDEVPAESVMHKCIVHFIPHTKRFPQPLRAKHPGFIVRKVYDACEKKLFNLTDKDYEDQMQKEIDLLVQKTREALGDLPDIDGEDTLGLREEDVSLDIKAKRRGPVRRTISPLNVKSDNVLPASDVGARTEPTLSIKSDRFARVETPPSAVGTDAEVSTLLQVHDMLLGVHARDRWVEKLVQTVRDICGGGKDLSVQSGVGNNTIKENETDVGSASKPRNGRSLAWPEVATAAMAVVRALEQLSHDSLGTDLHKYNLKMRQLDFNVKNNKVLAQRLLSKELEPATVINMSPAELKDGFTAAEKSGQEPPEERTLQMADVRCSLCGEREVAVKDIIHVGFGDRYQLECLKCGNSWYSSREAISSLVLNTATPIVGVAPWATSKFEEVEKELASPREAQGPSLVIGSSSAAVAAAIEMKAPTPHPPFSNYEELENPLTNQPPATTPLEKDVH